MPKAPPSIAATSTLAMVRAAEARGVETAELLERAGLTRECLEDPDSRIPGPTVLAIWSALRERAADPALQLVASTCLPFGAYRVIDYLVGASATVGEGIRRFARFFRLIADSVALDVRAEGDEHCLCLTTEAGGPVPPVYVDYVFAALVSRVRMRIRPELRVRRVELRQPAPPATAPYVEVFRAPVHFGAAADRLCFGDEEWGAPLATADASLAELLEEHARILRLRGAARGHVAREYLADPSVSIAEVAFLLGFDDRRSFDRAFRRWTGKPPGQWRRAVPSGGLHQHRVPRRAGAPAEPVARTAVRVHAHFDHYGRSGLGDAEAARLKEALLALMTRERPYRDPELTLADLARRLDTTPHKLSEVLNGALSQSFHDFVNGYRVEEVRRRLGESGSQHLKVLALAMDAGFASKSTFNEVFKKVTGQTPSTFRRALARS